MKTYKLLKMNRLKRYRYCFAGTAGSALSVKAKSIKQAVWLFNQNE